MIRFSKMTKEELQSELRISKYKIENIKIEKRGENNKKLAIKSIRNDNKLIKRALKYKESI